MPDWLTDIEPHWQWLSLGVLLAAAEIIAPGFFLIWIGVAAIVTGVIAWIVPLTVPLQLGSALPNVPISGRYQTLSGQMSTVPPSSANTFGPLTSVQPSTGVPLKYSVWPVHQSSPPSTANSPFALPPPVG